MANKLIIFHLSEFQHQTLFDKQEAPYQDTY